MRMKETKMASPKHYILNSTKWLIVLASTLLSINSLAETIRVNCPYHGLQTIYSRPIVCPKCEQQREQREAETRRKKNQQRKKAEKTTNDNEIFESRLENGTIINIRSFGNSDFFYRRCFSEITNEYCKIHGSIFYRKSICHRMKIIQHVGYCEYIVDVDKWYMDIPSKYNDRSFGHFENIGWHKIYIPTIGDDLADDEIGFCNGWPSSEIYEYTTVLGATKRIKVFYVVSNSDIESLTFEDVVDHLKNGNVFIIDFEHLEFLPDGSKCYSTAYRISLTKNEGKTVIFGK